LTEPAGAESSNPTNNYFKEPSPAHYFHPNSVYYDSRDTRAPARETVSNESSNDEKFADKGQEIGSREPYSHYTVERAEKEEKENAPSQGKLYEALRELALALEAIQTERYNQQQQQRKDGPSPKAEKPIFNVKTEKIPNFPPFTPELYPKADAGPLSILEQMGDSTGRLW
jgi:hypothetical protein